VGLRAGLDDVEKRKFLILPGLELRPISWALYRLRYPGSRYLGGPKYNLIFVNNFDMLLAFAHISNFTEFRSLFYIIIIIIITLCSGDETHFHCVVCL
jgi:hypothetical protein